MYNDKRVAQYYMHASIGRAADGIHPCRNIMFCLQTHEMIRYAMFNCYLVGKACRGDYSTRLLWSCLPFKPKSVLLVHYRNHTRLDLVTNDF